MRKIYIILLTLGVFSCNRQHKEVQTEGYDPTIFSNFKRDSIKYVFDRINKQLRYSYTITYLPIRKVDSFKVYQGDIIINSNLKQAPIRDTTEINREITIPEKLIGITPLSKSMLWPNGTIRYAFDKNDATINKVASINAAISAWQAVGLHFQKLPNPSGDCILFKVSPDHKLNLSTIGRTGNGMQMIYLTMDVSTGSIMHEIGHALGLWHEHCRPDRDKFIEIVSKNIDPADLAEFRTVAENFSYYQTDYDLNSIMHYDARAFGKTGSDGQKLVTILTKPGGKSIGQRDAPSKSDIQGIKRMYNLP